jgi:hypothetical protein
LSDVSYKVEIELSTKGNLSQRLGGFASKAEGLDTLFAKVGATASSIGGAIEGAVDKAASLVGTFAKLGAVAVGGTLVYGVAKLNNELERTQIALAAIFKANDLTTSIDAGMGLAGSVMKQMRRDAAELPGEFRDLVGIFKTVSVPGFQAGASINELRKLSAMAMSVSAVVGLPMEQTARELALLMEGRAGAHNVLGMRLAGLGGEKAHAFNKLSAPERLRVVTKELEKFAGAIDLYKKSFDGLSSTLIDNGKKFLSAATGPLFERVKGTLGGVNEWFDKNEASIDTFAGRIGERLGAAYDVVLAKIHAWGPAIEEFVQHASGKLAHLWEKLPGGDVGGKLVTLLELYGGAKLGAKGLGVAGGVIGNAGLFDTLIRSFGLAGKTAPQGAMWDSLAGRFRSAGTGQFVAGEAGGLAELLANPYVLAGAAAAAELLVTALVAVAGAMHAVTDAESQWHDEAVYLWDYVKEKTQTAMSSISAAVEAVTPLALYLADALGTALLFALTSAADAVATFASGIEKVASAVAAAAAVLGIGTSSTAPRPTGAAEGLAQIAPIVEALDKRASVRTGAGGGGGGTHIQKVEITVTTNSDPSRIARLVYSDLANLARHRTTSPDVRNFSASRP